MDRPSSSGRTNESAPQSTCIPGYILSEKLGAGSYATVYKAKLKSANAFEPNSNFAKCFGANPPQIVAVKCIDAKKCASEAAKDNLIREIGLLKRLRHRHIVTLYDFHWDANYIYLVLEYCAGGDLSLFIREHRILPEAVARKFLKQLASALFYLRTENIAHMDLKPQNLLLTDRYRPILKVGDFGFAQSLAPYELRTTFKGSPLYMAPEMFQRPVIYDAKVDLWSVGVILYECLFGKAPFASETYEQLIRQIISREEIVLPPRSPPLSLHCLHLLHALLQRDPRARINFDQFFMHRFIALLPANQRSIWHCANNPDGSQKLNAPYSSGVDASYLSSASFNYVQLADEAKQAGANAEKIDSLGQSDVQNVVDAYCTAVDRHLRALQCCDDPRETAQLRQRAAAYLRRAETLKSQLKSRDRSSSFDNRTQSGAFVDGRTLCSARESATKQSGDADFDDVQNVLDLWKDVPQVAAAVTVARHANKLHQYGDYIQAKSKYELAISTCLQIIGTVPRSGSDNRCPPLKKLVHEWLCRAEQLDKMIPSDAALNEQLGVSTVGWVREQLDEVLAGEDETERMLAQTGAPGHAPCALM